MAPRLINPLLQGGRVDALDGLRLAPGLVAADHLALSLHNGATVRLQQVQIRHPFGLLFAPQRNRAQLSVSRLSFVPAPDPDTTTTPPPRDTELPRAQGPKLSDIFELLRRLPLSAQIDHLEWQREKTAKGKFSLRRDYDSQTIYADFSSGRQQLSLQVETRPDQLRLSGRLGADPQQPALSLNAGLVPDTAGQWRLSADLETELQRLTGLPATAALDEIAASASGKLSANIRARIPDEPLQLQDYRNISAQLRGESVRFRLPEKLLGTTAEISLTTAVPLSVEFASLRPLQPQKISGTAALELTPAGEPHPLLRARLDTSTQKAGQLLTVEGDLNLAASDSLLQAPRWRRLLPPLAIESAAGSVALEGRARIHSRAGASGAGQHWLSDVTLSLLPDSRVSVTVEAEGDEKSLPSQIGWHRGQLALHLLAPVTLQAARWPGGLQVTGENLSVKASEESGKLSLESQLANIDCDISAQTSCTLELRATSEQFAHEASGLAVLQPSIDTRLEWNLNNGEQQWSLHDTNFEAGQISRKAVRIEKLSIRAPQLECTLAGGETVCTSGALSTHFGAFSAEGQRASGTMDFTAIQFRQVKGQPQLSASYRSDKLELQLQNRYQLDTDLSGKLVLNGDTLRGESRARAGNLRVQSQWQHNIDSQRGAADFALEEIEFSQRQPLSQSVQGLPVDLVAGKVAAQGRLSWPQTQQDSIELRLDGVAAVYNDSFAAGIHSRLSLHSRGDQWITANPQPVQLDTLDVGLPVENIRFSLSLDEKRDLTLGNLSAELLGGTLQSRALVWNLAGETRRSQVALNEISLRALAREMEAENFAATGTVDLQIPLSTGPEGITVEQGTVRARPPGGRLRYYGAFSAEMLSGNPQLKLLAGALEDYNYRALSGTLEYPPSGDMQLQLKLVGRSASVAADRDLIINLNLENNIPAMLRSLQASRDLTEALEKQVQ